MTDDTSSIVAAVPVDEATMRSLSDEADVRGKSVCDVVRELLQAIAEDDLYSILLDEHQGQRPGAAPN